MKVELVTHTTGVNKYSQLNPEEIIAAIARHGTIKEDNGKLVRYLMDHNHWSPLDMINFTFEIETSRAIGREILRHRSMCFQESSQRYSSKIKFEPIEIRKQSEQNRQSSTEEFDPLIDIFWDLLPASELIAQVLKDIDNTYKRLIDAGVAKECARMILPECTSTTLTVNGTLRSWLAFLNVRCDSNAQKEIQEIATAIGSELEKALPNIFAAIDWRKGLFM